MNPAGNQPQLFALLVGIDTYQNPIPPLTGCVNDVEKLTSYLQKNETYFNVRIRCLLNREATKSNIIDAFRGHLKMAKMGDTILFYYSGHGTQEAADPVFWPSEPDKKLESLVCYDSVMVADGKSRINLMADKELRFLIDELSLAGAHIVTIFDCCHSGTNTRNGNFTSPNEGIKVRRATYRNDTAFPKRRWEDFIFSNSVSIGDLEEKGIEALLPEGRYIQMAACQNDESAYEIGGEGIFTKNLIEVLQRCQGGISYNRLQGSIQNYMKHQFRQTPKIYSGKGEEQLFFCFLGKDMMQHPILGTVSFNEEFGWLLDMGSMQGISSGTELLLQAKNVDLQTTAKVEETHVTYALVSVKTVNGIPIARDILFDAEIQGFLSSSLHVYYDPEAESILNTFGIFSKMKSLPEIKTVKEPAMADYCLAGQGESLLLTTPIAMKIPIVPEINRSEEAGLILNYFKHLSQFHFVKYLENPSSFLLQPNDIAITLFSGEGADEVIPIRSDEALLNYRKINSVWSGAIRIKLKNVSGKKLFCSLCYLSFNFGVHTKILRAGVEGLPPGAEVWANEGASIRLKLEPEITHFGYKDGISYLKLLLSTEDFTQQLNSLSLDDLPGPLGGAPGFSKGAGIKISSSAVHDWTSRLITLRMPNPEI